MYSDNLFLPLFFTIFFSLGDIVNQVRLQFKIPKYSLTSKYNINNKMHGRHLRARAVARGSEMHHNHTQ